MIFQHTSSSAVNEEVLIDFRRNGDDVCAVPEDTDRNNKLGLMIPQGEKIIKKL